MSKEQQIEEMARVIEAVNYCKGYEDDRGCYFANSCKSCKNANRENSIEVAERLYEQGYRKQSVIEILENKLFKEIFEDVLFSLVYLGADGKWHTKRNNAEKTTAIIERYLKLVAIEEGGE